VSQLAVSVEIHDVARDPQKSESRFLISSGARRFFRSIDQDAK
jgi:hypothetical protein